MRQASASSEQFTLAVSSLSITTTSPLPPGTVDTLLNSTVCNSPPLAVHRLTLGLLRAARHFRRDSRWIPAPGFFPERRQRQELTILESPQLTAPPLLFPVTVNFTLVVSGAQNLAGLNGSYAFEFSGYNSTGFVAFAGTFTANGTGGITAGEEDYNVIGSTPVNYTNLMGTYTLGTDGRGTFTFTGSTPAQPAQQYTYAFSIDATGNGRFIEFDSTGTRGSGRIAPQTVTTCVVGTTTNVRRILCVRRIGICRAGRHRRIGSDRICWSIHCDSADSSAQLKEASVKPRWTRTYQINYRLPIRVYQGSISQRSTPRIAPCL